MSFISTMVLLYLITCNVCRSQFPSDNGSVSKSRALETDEDSGKLV